MAIMSKFGIAAAAAVLALSVPSVASAAPVINFAGASGTFGNAPGSNAHFFDTYTFNVPHDGEISIDITSTYLLGNTATNVNFVPNYVTFNGAVIPIITTGVDELRRIVSAPVVTGLQTIIVHGASQVNGAYSGIISFAGVPEPATWGLMILGFGSVGAAMRRRRSASTTAAALA